MTSRADKPQTPSDFVGQQVRELRRRRGLTAQQLAERCTAIGAPEMSAQTISNIETGRRDKDRRRRREITVDELFILAYALNTAPLSLLVDDEGAPYPVTPTLTAAAQKVWAWNAGQGPLKVDGAGPLDFDERLDYFTALPKWKQAEERHLLAELAELAAEPDVDEITLDDEHDEGGADK